MRRIWRLTALLAVTLLCFVALVAIPAGSPAGPTAAGAYPLGEGYWMALDDGTVVPFGEAQYYGSMHDVPLSSPIVAMTPFPLLEGYWLAAADGGVFAYGASRFYGSLGDLKLNAPIVGMAATPTGRGYWLAAADGGVFAFGDAEFFGSEGARALNKPIVGVAATPSGKGYYLVATDGGIFAHGDAEFYGSEGGLVLNRPIRAMATTVTGMGYYLVATDGGVFAHGDAVFYGSMGGTRLNSPITAMMLSTTGRGYSLIARDGGVFSYGDALFLGSLGDRAIRSPVRTAALRPRLAAATIAFGNSESAVSQWLQGEDGDWRLLFFYLGGEMPSGAQIIGIEGIDVEQLGTVSFDREENGCVDLVLGYDRGEGTEIATLPCMGADAETPHPSVRPADTVPADARVVGLQLRVAPMPFWNLGSAMIDDVTVAGVTMSGPGVFRMP